MLSANTQALIDAAVAALAARVAARQLRERAAEEERRAAEAAASARESESGSVSMLADATDKAVAAFRAEMSGENPPPDEPAVMQSPPPKSSGSPPYEWVSVRMAAARPRRTLLRAKAHEVAAYGFDPLTILAVLSALVKAMSACWPAPEAAARLKKPGLLVELRTLRLCRDHAASREQAEEMAAAVLDAAQGLTPSEVTQLYAEV